MGENTDTLVHVQHILSAVHWWREIVEGEGGGGGGGVEGDIGLYV